MNALIVGAGAQGRVVLDILRCQGNYESIGFVDDDPSLWGGRISGAVVSGSVEDGLAADPAGTEVIVAIGKSHIRTRLAERFREKGFRLLNAIHPSAMILPSVRVGQGNVIAAGCVVNTDARIGDCVVVNVHSTIEHDTTIEDGVNLGCRVTIGGRVRIGQAAFIGINTTVLLRLTVGAGAVIGAGALVTRDIPERVYAVGVPAREFGTVGSDFDWNRFL